MLLKLFMWRLRSLAWLPHWFVKLPVDINFNYFCIFYCTALQLCHHINVTICFILLILLLRKDLFLYGIWHHTTQHLLVLWNIKEDILSILSMELLLGSQCSSEYLLLCSVEVRNAYRFGMTRGWINDDIFGLTNLKFVSLHVLVEYINLNVHL